MNENEQGGIATEEIGKDAATPTETTSQPDGHAETGTTDPNPAPSPNVGSNTGTDE